jgi:putative DNA primase/helicase
MPQRKPPKAAKDNDQSNVVNLKEERENRKLGEAKSPPALQNQLDILTSRLITFLDDNGLGLRFAEGVWFYYEQGQWSALSQNNMQQLTFIVKDRAEEVGLVYAKDKSTIWAHLESTREFYFDPLILDTGPYVVVRNGTVDVTTGEISAHSPEHWSTRYVDIVYDPDAKCPGWIKSLERAFEDREPDERAKLIDLLQEFFGVALAGGARSRTPRDLRKALFLYGPPRSGKSTIIEVLEHMLGAHTIVRSNARAVADKHELENFLGASAWITNEQSGLDKPIDTARIKCLITGEPLSVPRKYKTATQLVFNGPVVWAGNTQPNFPESSRAVYDRTMVVAMERTFSAEDAKRDFEGLRPLEWLEARGEFPGIYIWALEGYKRAVERGHYAHLPELESGASSWRASNDPVYAFVLACTEPCEGVSNTVDCINWSAHAYITHHEGRPPKMGVVKRALATTIPDTHSTAKKGRMPSNTKPREYYWSGLALNELGLSYLKQAERDHPNVAELNLRPNQKSMVGRAA